MCPLSQAQSAMKSKPGEAVAPQLAPSQPPASSQFLPALVFPCRFFGSLAVSCPFVLLGVRFGWQRRGKDQDRPEPERQQTNRTNRTNDNYAVCPRLLFQLVCAWFHVAFQCWGLCFHCRGLLLESGGCCFSLVLLGFPMVLNAGGSGFNAGWQNSLPKPVQNS